MKASFFYRPLFWQCGLLTARHLPLAWSRGIGRAAAEIYRCARPRRAQVVAQNLLPVFAGDRAQAGAAARSLFRQFGRKVADLWWHESGQAVDHLFTRWSGWEHFEAACADRHGVLLVTPHLGNWEFGAPLLRTRGIQVIVISLEEPHPQLTEWRRRSRQRWGIETVVIGNNPFAFVEIIRRLESGATVALLIDRPSPAAAFQVDLFGRPFQASIAPAELARASGCHLLPVYLPQIGRGYEAHVLPPIPYERAALRDRQERRALTQQILRAFEPAIRQHVDQWYHFIPVWRPSSPESSLQEGRCQ